jgi:hypothetical protein
MMRTRAVVAKSPLHSLTPVRASEPKFLVRPAQGRGQCAHHDQQGEQVREGNEVFKQSLYDLRPSIKPGDGWRNIAITIIDLDQPILRL